MLFEVLGIVSLMCCSGAAAAALAYDLGEARAARMWEERVRRLSERVGEIHRTTVLFAAVDSQEDRHGCFNAAMEAHSNSKFYNRKSVRLP